MTELLVRYIVNPVTIALLVLVAALIADHYGKRGAVRGLIVAAAFLFVSITILPIDDFLARPLETAYARPPLPAHVDGIVVLNGGLKLYLYEQPDIMGDNSTVLRMIAGAALAKRYPQAKFVFSGTSTGGRAREFEFDAVETFLVQIGVAPGRTIYERRSLDTYENLRFTRALMHPKPGETWVLVTSALHMPRAMAVADKMGWKMVPWPSDYKAAVHGHPFRPLSDHWATIDYAIHEWIGLAVYRITGRL